MSPVTTNGGLGVTGGGKEKDCFEQNKSVVGMRSVRFTERSRDCNQVRFTVYREGTHWTQPNTCPFTQ